MELPELERRICADMRKKDSGSANLLLRDGEIRSGLYQYRSKKKFSEKTIGYIPVLPGGQHRGKRQGIPAVYASSEKSFVKAYIVPVLLLLLLAGLILGSFWYLREDDIPGLDESAIAYHVEGVKNTGPQPDYDAGDQRIYHGSGEIPILNTSYNPEGIPATLNTGLSCRTQKKSSMSPDW